MSSARQCYSFTLSVKLKTKNLIKKNNQEKTLQKKSFVTRPDESKYKQTQTGSMFIFFRRVQATLSPAPNQPNRLYANESEKSALKALTNEVYKTSVRGGGGGADLRRPQ